MTRISGAVHIALVSASDYGFNGRGLHEVKWFIEQHQVELLEAWNEHLG
jgi:hypothetical protein